MNRKLEIEIDCGDTTCASAPGKFCRFAGARRWGTVPVCLLFPDQNPSRQNVSGHTGLDDKDGWVQRCQGCLDAEKGK